MHGAVLLLARSLSPLSPANTSLGVRDDALQARGGDDARVQHHLRRAWRPTRAAGHTCTTDAIMAQGKLWRPFSGYSRRMAGSIGSSVSIDAG